jgi:hypothetical protein
MDSGVCIIDVYRMGAHKWQLKLLIRNNRFVKTFKTL